MKVIVGAFAHESNSFSTSFTTKEMFEYYQGEKIFEQIPIDDIFERVGFEIVPSIYAVAPSSGLLKEETYHYYAEKILSVVRRNPDVDGVWLFCHGAMSVENIGSGEYQLASDIRKLVKDTCILSFGMDLHGNIEYGFEKLVNIFRCYHTAPHTDQVDTYRRTALALVNYLTKGFHNYSAVKKIPMILPGEMAATTVEPFKGIIRYMKDLEQNDPKILCASTFIGFAWADYQRTSSTAVIVPSSPDDLEYCQNKADELAKIIYSKRNEFDFETLSLSPTDTVKAALYELSPPVCITDMGDNPTAGASGGSTILLDEFLKINDQDKNVLIVGLYDKNAFNICINSINQDELNIKLGINIDNVTRPIDVTVRVVGHYDIEGYVISPNLPTKQCEGVLVTLGNIDIVITDKPFAFTQKINFSSCLLNLNKYDAVVTKFGYIFPELKEIANNFIMSNTPGESYQMIKNLTYKNLRRPIFPLDDI